VDAEAGPDGGVAKAEAVAGDSQIEAAAGWVLHDERVLRRRSVRERVREDQGANGYASHDRTAREIDVRNGEAVWPRRLTYLRPPRFRRTPAHSAAPARATRAISSFCDAPLRSSSRAFCSGASSWMPRRFASASPNARRATRSAIRRST